jgi:hypothetical protein
MTQRKRKEQLPATHEIRESQQHPESGNNRKEEKKRERVRQVPFNN